MQSFQIPRPASIPGPGKRPGQPGPPGRVPGPQPGGRPGLPKPKNPALVGGKPMVPISSLIQFTPYTDPEGTSEKQEPGSAHDKNEKDTKLNGEIGEGTQEAKDKEKESGEKKFEGQTLNQDPEDSKPTNINEKREESSEVPPPLNKGKKDTNFDMGLELSPKKVEGKSPFENKKEKIGFEAKPVAQEEFKGIRSDEEGITKKINDDNEEKPNKLEEQVEKPPKVEKSGDNVENEVKVDSVDQEEPKDMNIPSPDAYANVKAGPFSIKRGIKETVKNNAKRNNEEPNAEAEDQEETGLGDQSPSPITKNTEIYKAQQDEPRDFGIIEEPPMGIGFGMKAKMNLIGDEIESPNGRVTSYTSKESESRREEETALLAKLKVLEFELEKERNEKAAIKDDQERLLNENSDLKAQLLNANSKLEELSKQETDTHTKDLLRKEEQIKRLRADLKSTMEGSRMITEHSNRVISESTKFKLDTEAIIVSLEQEKEDLHQRFIDYKKQVQKDYIAKATTLQDLVDNLEEKNKEYEREIERLQADLKQKAEALHKLVSLGDDVQSTLSNWPNFDHFYQKPQEELKVSYPKNYSSAPMELDKSPAGVVVKDNETEKNTESQPVIESLNNDKRLQGSETETVLEQDSRAYDNKEEAPISKPTILEPEVNTILTDYHHQEQTTTNEITEEPPKHTPVTVDHEVVQPLEEEAWNVEEPVVEDVEYKQEEQAPEKAWEIEEPVLEDSKQNENQQEEPVLEKAWQVEEPLLEETQHEQKAWQIEEPLLEDTQHKQNGYQQEEQVLEDAWGVEQPIVDDTQNKQVEYQQEEQVLENAWGVEQPLVEDTQQKQDEHQQEEQVVENAWEIEQPPVEDTQQKQDEYHQEKQEEPRQEEKLVQEETVPIEEPPRGDEAFINIEAPPTEHKPVPNVEITPEQDPEYNVRHEIQGEKVSQDALSAPPSYRLLQKKKKAAPAPRQFVGFKPAQTTFDMLQEPPITHNEENPSQEESNVDSNAVHTNYQDPEQQLQEVKQEEPSTVHTNYQEPEQQPQEVKQEESSTVHTNYQEPKEQPQEVKQEEPSTVHTNNQEPKEQPQEVKQQEPQETSVKPPVFFSRLHKKRVPQTDPFGSANNATKPQPFNQNKGPVPQNGKLADNHTNQHDTSTGQQHNDQRPPTHDPELPVLGPKTTSIEASMPRKGSYYDTAPTNTENYEQHETNKTSEHENKYEMNGYSHNTHNNGYEQSHPAGRVVPSTKVIKKRVPSSGSIF